MFNKETQTIGIIGLGLIGGSLAKALAQKDYSIIALAHSDSTFNKARKLDIFKLVTKNIEELNGCSVIFVATPINAINITFTQLNSIITNPCIITDAASIKGEISDFAVKTFTNKLITFIPGHPMAGTEYKGIDNSFPELFRRCRWVLCPSNPAQKKHIEVLNTLIEETGAAVIYANPHTHDMAVALISHMPLLVSMGLMDVIDSEEDIILKELSLYLAASGYRDITRLSAGNSELSYDMLKYNQKNVLKALDKFEQAVVNLKELLNSDRDDVMNKFDDISKVRSNLYSQEGKNIFKGLSG